MIVFESCELADGAWVDFVESNVRLWVRRVGDVVRFQRIAITLFGTIDCNSLRTAIHEVNSNNSVPVVEKVALATAWDDVQYQTDHEACDRWATAENGCLILKVKRPTKDREKELRIRILTPLALHELVQMASKL